MRLPLVPLLLLIAVSVLVDIFIYRRLRQAHTPRGGCITYVVVSVMTLMAVGWVTLAPKKSTGDSTLVTVMWVLYAYLSLYIPKIVYCVAELVRIPLARLLHRPLRGIGYAGAAAAAIVFAAMWWGALFNRNNIDVVEQEIHIESLPASFRGYRIVQLSDIHSGTWGTDTSFISRVVDRVNSLDPDLIVFTGDIVNRHSPELRPFTPVLARLRARDGVYSIMGNHDYGDYYRWDIPEARLADIDSLRAMQRAMGWNMLDNSHTWLRRGADSVALVGVENIGDPPFHTYGSLDRAYPATDDGNIKILLSHNPAHWVDSIADVPERDIVLTLAGHTHAMQIEVAGHSPAAFRYPTWGGLYTDSLGRHLYVNIDIGTVGFPARIGATPEITVITLR